MQIGVEFIQRFTLGVSAGEAGNEANVKPSVRTAFDYSSEGFHGVNVRFQTPGVNEGNRRRDVTPLFISRSFDSANPETQRLTRIEETRTDTNGQADTFISDAATGAFPVHRTSQRNSQRDIPMITNRIEPVLSMRAREKVREAAALVLHRVENKRLLPLKNLMLPLLVQSVYSRCLVADSLGSWESRGEPLWIPRFHFQRTQTVKQRIQVSIFAGIHGDEPAGILGVMDFIRELDENPELGRDFELWIYPVCNPGGSLDKTRESRTGTDLNREFWQASREPEVRLLEREIVARQFDGIISLHSDDSSPGFYGYARGNVLATELLAPALDAAERAQARDSRSCIDGFQAVNGIIHNCFDGILSAPAEQRPQPFEIVLESPSNTPIADQRQAFVFALQSILAEYRKFISYGADL